MYVFIQGPGFISMFDICSLEQAEKRTKYLITSYVQSYKCKTYATKNKMATKTLRKQFGLVYGIS